MSGWKADPASAIVSSLRVDAEMYRVTVECHGLAQSVGEEAAADIEREFGEHRTWHQRPACSFADSILTLTVENDFDADGRATLDEFADCIVAYVGEHGPVRVTDVEVTPRDVER